MTWSGMTFPAASLQPSSQSETVEKEVETPCPHPGRRRKATETRATKSRITSSDADWIAEVPIRHQERGRSRDACGTAAARLETVTVALERRCERCHGILGPSRVDRRFCSTACRMAAYRARRAPSWQASALFLERSFPERWGPARPIRIVHSEPSTKASASPNFSAYPDSHRANPRVRTLAQSWLGRRRSR